MFVNGKPPQPCVIKHSSILGPFISLEENEVLWQSLKKITLPLQQEKRLPSMIGLVIFEAMLR